MRRVLLLAPLLAAACLSGGGPVKHPDTYTYLSIGDIESLDPAWARDTASQSVILQIYENLVAYDGGRVDAFVPRIAARVPTRANGLLSPDGRVYRFPIRKDVRFHDGTPLTPEDVRYSLLRFCLQDRLGGPSVYLLEPLAGARTVRPGGEIDPRVFERLRRAVQVEGGDVVVRLPRAYPPLLGVLATWAPIVSKKWAAAHGDWDGAADTWREHVAPQLQDSPFFEGTMGSGPFRLERWSRKDKGVILARYDGYWRGPARLKRVIVRAVPEFATRRLMLQAGDADSIYAERTEYSALAGVDNVRIRDDLTTLAMNPVLFFTFDIRTEANPYIGSGKLDGEGIPPDFFADRDVRLGFAYAVDADGFIRDVSKGKAERAAGAIPKPMFGHAADLPRRPFDLERAAEHFKRARGGRVWERGFRLTLAYNSGNEPRGMLARMIKRSVESLNPKFRVDVQPVLWPTYLAALNARKMPAFIIGWVGSYPDPDAYAAPFLRSGEFFPTMQGFSDPALDRLIDKAKRTVDAGTREKLYAEIQRRAHDMAVQVYVQDEKVFRAERSWVEGYVHQPMFPAAPHFSRVYELQKTVPKPKN